MILITRPREDNDKLSILLSKKNIRHKKENLTSFRILKKKIECHPDKVFLVASKQAVRSLSSKKNKDEFKKSSFIVIGHKVKKELQNLKVKKVLVFAETSELLLDKIKLSKKVKGHTLEYLCSNIYNRQFVRELKQVGFKVLLNQVYETIPKKKLNKSTSDLIMEGKMKVVVFFSIFSYKTFLKLCKLQGLNKRHLSKLEFIAYSNRIAREIKKSQFGVLAAKPSSIERIISLLKKYKFS